MRRDQRSSLKLPLRHWACLFAVACVLTAVLFTRCCGHLLAPVAWLLIVPYILGSLVGSTTPSVLEALGFAMGLTVELAVGWWLLRAAALLALGLARRGSRAGEGPG